VARATPTGYFLFLFFYLFVSMSEVWSRRGIIFVVSAFFLLYIWLPLSAPSKFNSPDETANYFWAREFAKSGKLYKFETINLEVGDIVHPRSMISINGFILPGSFLGLPLIYGALGKILSIKILPFLTAIIAVLAALSWRLIISKIWGQREGYISFLLFLIHPVIFYYTARGFFHNVPFISFLIFAAYFFITKPLKGLRLNYFLGSIMAGLAMLLRTAEIIWLVPALLLLIIIGQGKTERRSALAVTVMTIVFFTGFLFLMNYWLYGHPLRIGYTAAPQALVSETENRDAEVSFIPQSTFNKFLTQSRNLAKYALPFGFHPRTIFYSIKDYFLGLFPWFSVPVILGILVTLYLSLRQRLQFAQKIYLAVSIVLTTYFLINYGSFALQDNPTLRRITVTSSYLRYWLPAFVILLPFAAKCLLMLADFIKSRFLRLTFLGAEIIFIAALSLHLSFYGLDDGLFFVKDNIWSFSRARDRAIEITEPDSIIIVDRADKIFFPERKVVYPLRDENTFRVLPQLESRAPVYYYGLGIHHEETRALNARLVGLGLQMERLEIFGKEVLYRIKKQEVGIKD